MKKIPLTPTDAGGLCIDKNSLQVGDIVVSTTSAAGSAVIRTATWSEVSHAMIYAGQGIVIEAISEGGVKIRALDLALKNSRLGVAYRHKQITDSSAKRVVAFARLQNNKSYDMLGAIGAGISDNPITCVLSGIRVCVLASAGGMDSDDKFFCSELVLMAFEKAGIPIVNKPAFRSTPQDIVGAYNAKTLGYIGHLKS